MTQPLDPNCTKLIRLLANHGGTSDLKSISDDWRQDVPLTLSHWHSSSSEEPQWRYEIRQAFYTLKESGLISGREHGDWSLNTEGNSLAYLNEPPNPRTQQIFMRIVRDSEIVRQLKSLYDHQCQVCGTTVKLANQHYSEAHHIQPLGAPHHGPDTKENLIILCPNHHIYFDYFAMAINPESGLVETVSEYGTNKLESRPLALHYHEFSSRCLQYHYEAFVSNINQRAK